MKKIVTFMIFFIIPFVGLLASKNQRYQKDEIGIPYFYIEAPAYPSDLSGKVRIDVYIKIPYEAIQFLKFGNGFKANYELSISILDSNDLQVVEEIAQGEVIVQRYQETISPKMYGMKTRSFEIEPGNYKLEVSLMDIDTRKVGKKSQMLDLTRFDKDIVISDLLFIDTQIKDKEGYPYGYPIIPSTVSNGDSALHIYYELKLQPGPYSVTTKLINSKDKILSEEKVEEKSSGGIIQKVVAVTPNGITTKNFKVRIKLEQSGKISKSEHLVKIRWQGLSPHVTDLNEAINQLRYIAPTNEIRAMKKAVRPKKKEELFKDFWKRKDPTPNTPENELMDEYYRRVNYANERYGSFQKGWETARGMIFILFGPPDDIETNLFSPDGKAYQRWSYYVINKTFIFVDKNGFGDYELLEPYYPTISGGK